MPSTKVFKMTTSVENKVGPEGEQVQYRITILRELAEEYELEDV